jgi:hypothetical protein
VRGRLPSEGSEMGKKSDGYTSHALLTMTKMSVLDSFFSSFCFPVGFSRRCSG